MRGRLDPVVVSLHVGLCLRSFFIAAVSVTAQDGDLSLAQEGQGEMGLDSVWQRGEFATATDVLERCYAELAREDRRSEQIDTLLQWGEAYQALGQLRRSQDVLENALSLVREADALAELAQVNRSLGRLKLIQGDRQQARVFLEASIAQAETARQPAIASASLNNLGNLLVMQGNLRAAHAAFKQAAGQAIHADDRKIRIDALINLADAAINSGDIARGKQILQQVEALIEALTASHDKASQLLVMGQLWLATGAAHGLLAPRVVSRAHAMFSEARDAIERLKAAELEDYFQDECVAELQGRITRLDRPAAGTAAIYPMLFPDRTELLVGIGENLFQFTVPVSRLKLTEEVRAFRRLLEKRTTHEYRPHAQTLYRWLIEPLHDVVAANAIDTVAWCSMVPCAPFRCRPYTMVSNS